MKKFCTFTFQFVCYEKQKTNYFNHNADSASRRCDERLQKRQQ